MSGGDSISNIKQSNEREVHYINALESVRKQLKELREMKLRFVNSAVSSIIDYIGDALYE